MWSPPGKGNTSSTRFNFPRCADPSRSEPILSRSGVEPPTGTIHPRQISAHNSKSGKTHPTINPLIDSCFLPSVPLPSRGWIVPVPSRSGVEPPTGKLHPRQISAHNSKSGKTHPTINPLIDSCLLPSVPLLSRGWIVPVGGSTPDRHQADRLKLDRHKTTSTKLPLGNDRETDKIPQCLPAPLIPKRRPFRPIMTDSGWTTF